MDALLCALRGRHTPKSREKFWFCIVDNKPAPTLLDIKVAVMKFYCVSRGDMTSTRRGRAAKARMVAMYLGSVLTGHSYGVIAKFFKRCDHTVSMHAVKRISALMELDPQLSDEVSSLEASLT